MYLHWGLVISIGPKILIKSTAVLVINIDRLKLILKTSTVQS